MANGIIKHVPNGITSLNLFCGCIAIIQALQGNILVASILIIAAAVFDFFDGMSARALKAYSPIGKELDSLADCVSFGVAPGMIVYFLLKQATAVAAICPFMTSYFPYIAFIIPIYSALRLAKFNVDERQTTSFIGLPTPANALFWLSFAYSAQAYAYEGNPLFIGVTSVLILLTSYLLIAEIPMFSLKVKSLAFKGNEVRYILIISAIVLIALFQFMGISATILLYVLLSIFNKKK